MFLSTNEDQDSPTLCVPLFPTFLGAQVSKHGRQQSGISFCSARDFAMETVSEPLDRMAFEPPDYVTAPTELSDVENLGSCLIAHLFVKIIQLCSKLCARLVACVRCVRPSPEPELISEVDSEVDSELLYVGNLDENRETLERLRQDPRFSDFFNVDFPDLEVGRKIAQGGQADIYEVKFTVGGQKERLAYVVKVFRRGYSLIDLQRQWPQGIVKGRNSRFFSGTSLILGGLLLEDGRFAFVLRREWGDLRELIDLRMHGRKCRGPPFTGQCAKKVMLEIAMGMRQLHNRGILHRDLKASNVLVCTPYPRDTKSRLGYPAFLDWDIDTHAFNTEVFDFESTFGTLGTGFWRAPEILQAIQDRCFREFMYTPKADVYSYAMTCYEILTGCIPFEGIPPRNYNLVLCGQRPELPSHMDMWLRDLIEKCWDEDPLKRPEFDEIVKAFQANFPEFDEIVESFQANFPEFEDMAKVF